MIRRGLQSWLVVGIVALGAAPCLGQYDGTIPHRVTVVSTNNSAYSGVYILTGTTNPAESSLGGVYQRYTTGGLEPYWLSWRNYPETDATRRYRVSFLISSEYPTTWSFNGGAELVYQLELTNVTVGTSPTSIPLVNMGEAIVDWIEPTAANPYDDAFPDWQSAGVKIPLGFALGMTFWAAAVALTIPMKWVKELVSAAS